MTGTPSKDRAEARTFEFDRYVDGILMAEGVTIEREATLERAMDKAARIASRGHDGKVPVLVLRAEQGNTFAEGMKRAPEIARAMPHLKSISPAHVSTVRPSDVAAAILAEIRER